MKTHIKYTDCQVATMRSGGEPYGLIRSAAIVVTDNRVEWIGASEDAPECYQGIAEECLEGRVVTPALIDCHTHLVFGGNRAREFEARLEGASYKEIAQSGGGIISTVRDTRQASFRELLDSARGRLDDLVSEGVSVVEIKSGYGLTIDHEMRMLRVARELERESGIKVVTTWLAAHALPPEYEGRADDYIDEVVIEGLRQAHAESLVDAVDGFCESIGFTRDQMQRVFEVAVSLGLPVKLHAEQLSDQKGARLVSDFKGLSADHLEYLADSDVEAFSNSGAVAVMLPGAYYILRETQPPPIKLLRSHNVDMAVASDCNPGSSPISSILTTMNIACSVFSMTPEEVLAGVTRNAAKALGLSGMYGVVEPGAVAELAVWNISHPAELSYWVGGTPLFKKISHGRNL